MGTRRPARTGLLTLALVAALAGAGPTSAVPRTAEPVPEPGPHGSAFPLGFYSVHTDRELATVREAGWNLVQEYGFARDPDYAQKASDAGLWWLASVPDAHHPPDADRAARMVERWSARPGLGWWTLPEELAWWKPREWRTLKAWSRAVRRHDPERRPVYLYLPGNFSAGDLAHYVPWLDVVPATAYPHYEGYPRAGVRYQIAKTMRAIRRSGATVGDDYAAGEKTPAAVLELFWDGEHRPPNAREVYHDAWQAVAGGARAVLVYSYYHRRDRPSLLATRDAYFRFSRQLTGPLQLDRAFLSGEPVPGVTVRVVDGPPRTPRFRPPDGRPARSYPSVRVRTVHWEDARYVIAVSSSPRPVAAELAGLGDASQVEDLFGGQDGSARLHFGAYGVHVLRVPD